MGGRMILFAVICFLAYWGWQYYKSTQAAKEKKKIKDPADFPDIDGDPDVLRAYYERKIHEMEEGAVKGIEYAQEQLKQYKEKLEKLNNLKK